MRAKRLRRVLVFLGVVILVCLFAVVHMATGIGVRPTKNKPNESDLVGTYRPNLKTRLLIERDTKSPATNCFIKLGRDGKIEMVNIMRWVDEDGTNRGTLNLAATNATWKLEEYEKSWVINYNYYDTNGIIHVMGYLPLVGEKPPYIIEISTWQTGVPFYFIQQKP